MSQHRVETRDYIEYFKYIIFFLTFWVVIIIFYIYTNIIRL